jgi:hypothetical protein
LIDALLGDPPAEDWRVYLPVLRAKASEWKALAALSPGVRRRTSPIIEFVPYWKEPGASTSTRQRRAPKTPAAYVQHFLESCVKATPSATRSFVYFGLAGPEAKWSGMHLWSEFEICVPAQKRIIPLIDLPAVKSSAVLAHVARSRGEAALRFESIDVGPTLAARITDALRSLELTAASVHLVLDLKDAPAAVSHARLRAALVNANEFASVVLLAGVFPRDLTDYHPGITAEPRIEWQAWSREHFATPVSDRLFGFGDYTTQCAHYRPSPEVPGSVSLRYTTDEAILVFRGRQSNSSTGLGHEQMHGHCRLLVNRPDYDGAAFSDGDQRIHCWTNPANGTGNAMQWRAAAIVHHITHAVVQLQDSVGSSATVRAWARGQVTPDCS